MAIIHRSTLLAVFALFVLTLGTASAQAPDRTAKAGSRKAAPAYAPDYLLVRMRHSTPPEMAEAIHRGIAAAAIVNSNARNRSQSHVTTVDSPRWGYTLIPKVSKGVGTYLFSRNCLLATLSSSKTHLLVAHPSLCDLGFRPSCQAPPPSDLEVELW